MNTIQIIDDPPSGTEYYPDGSLQIQSWYKDGKYHRDGDKPAIIFYYPDGSIEGQSWYKNGKLHRDDDKPAVINYSRDGSIHNQYWYKNHEHHRLTGPAYMSKYVKTYMINGAVVSTENFYNHPLVKATKLVPVKHQPTTLDILDI